MKNLSDVTNFGVVINLPEATNGHFFLLHELERHGKLRFS